MDGVGRYYDPATGQFLSVDQKVEQTQQAYLYVGDDPVNGSDPSGMMGGAPDASLCGKPGHSCKGSAWSLLPFVAEIGGMVVLGVLTDGVGDVVLGGLEAGAESADIGASIAEEEGAYKGCDRSRMMIVDQ